MNEEIINTGVILGQRPEDYMAGAFTFVSYEERLPSGNWQPYLPTGERQRNLLETMACVSFSACNCIETQIKKFSGVEENYSDRWIAKMSGTTHDGNYLWKVGDTIRQYGMVKESSYPSRTDMKWDEYYAEIPPAKLAELKAEGQAWLKQWAVKTEFIEATKPEMLKHIKHTPIQIVKPGHAIEDFYNTQDIVNYFDSYSPFLKTLNYSQVQAAYKYVLTPMEQVKKLFINDNGKIYCVLLQGFGGTVVAAKSPEALANFKKDLEFTGTEPTYNYPN